MWPIAVLANGIKLKFVMKQLNNPVVGLTSLGSQLVVNMHQRLGGIVMTESGPTTMLTMPIIEWLRSEAEYSLDAPEKIPGGSCYSDVLDCPKGHFESLSNCH